MIDPSLCRLLFVSKTSAFLIYPENQQRSKTFMKSALEVPENSYKYVSYSTGKFSWGFAIVSSLCVVFFSLLPAWQDEERMLCFFEKSCIWEMFRQIFRMTTLKSGFKKAYISGFTSELVATVKSETVSNALGRRSGRLKIVLTVVEYKIGNQQNKNAVETMQKTLATWASDEIRRSSFLCCLEDSKSFLIVKLRRTCLKIWT